MRARLDDDAAAARLAELPGWERTGDEIVRTFDCGDFPSAVAFVVRVGFLAEAMDHHPDLDLRYAYVDVRLISHDVGAVTDRDVRLARTISGLAAGEGVPVEA